MGAAGGVGSIAVQLAAAARATVIASALPEDEAIPRDIGVSKFVSRKETWSPRCKLCKYSRRTLVVHQRFKVQVDLAVAEYIATFSQIRIR